NCVVDADHALAALVDDGVDGHGGLAGLPVANDQFALSSADRHHPVDRLQTRLQWFFHRLPIDNARSQTLDRQKLLRGNWPFTVDRLTECIDDSAKHLVADGHRNDAAGTFD